MGSNHIKVTLNGQTKTNTTVTMSQVGTTLGTITARPTTDNLDIGFYGATTGTCPYKQQMSEYSGVSQVEYKISKTVFTNYKVRVYPTKSD